MADEIKELIKKRGSYKGRITVFSTYLNNLNESLTPSEVCELQLRVNKIESLYEAYDELQLRIECLTDDPALQISERSDFETSYYKSLAKAQNLLVCHAKPIDSISDVASSRVTNHKLVKLPTIQLPKFWGSYDNWLEFHDTFKSLIHSNDEIDNINKFHYLRATLEGPAAVIIQSIEFSAKNYIIAWKLLCERFDNKRLLIQNHVSALFNIEPITKESSVSLKRVNDQLNKNLRALESLGEPTKQWDTLLIHIVSHKLDAKTYREWEEVKSKLDKDKTITLDTFLSFTRSKVDLLETLEMSRVSQTPTGKGGKLKSMVSVTNTPQSGNTQPPSEPANVSASSTKSCAMCKNDHYLNNCPQFLALSNEKRLQSLSSCKVCYNCFRSGHYANHCKSTGCKVCKRKHNTLVHVADVKLTLPGSTSRNSADTQAAQTDVCNMSISCVGTSSQRGYDVLLSTALIKVYDSNNQPHTIRVLLDSGSTSCLITKDVCHRLKLASYNTDKTLIGINNVKSHISEMVRVPVKSLDENYSNNLVCFVLPSLSEMIPCKPVDLSCLKIPTNINLADPNFHTPSAIDLIIGADIFWDILGTQKISLGRNKPMLCETKLGWLVSGPINSGHALDSSYSISCNHAKVGMSDTVSLNDDIQNQLTRFWQLEEVDPKSSYYSQEEQMCEAHFIENTTRLADGRFCVRIPLKQSQDKLGNSYQRANHCLLSLERRFKLNPSLKKDYCNFMSEYQSLGHMSECKFNPQQLAYFIPHHGIIRELSTTTTLRVVFNASAPTTTGVSLNNIQMVGPTIQDDLVSILLRFRQYRYVLAADIEKMYRQVVVHPSDRHLQQIIWRENPSDAVKVYQLNTVSYETASAPYLAVRCLKQIGIDCEDPKIAEIILHDFYVDDLLCGADTIEDLRNIRSKVTDALNSARMPLRKFKSNVPQILSKSEEQSALDLNIADLEICKTLGLGWHPLSDEIYFSISTNLATDITKRNILSVIAQIFDPMSILSPCIILMKMLLQKLWLQRISWDDKLPPEIQKHWIAIITALPALNNVRVPRQVTCDAYDFLDIHIFTDASVTAYGACAYVRSGNSRNGDVLVRLLLAKSRVAPIKPTTIPRLELCGAMVGTPLHEKIKSALRVQIRNVTIWTDSTIVLGWLKMLPSKLQPFVRNRVAEINEQTGDCTWRHVPTDQNPADLISRGVSPDLIHSSDLWWYGPQFLKESESQWPLKSTTAEKLPEMKPEVSLYIAAENGQLEPVAFLIAMN